MQGSNVSAVETANPRMPVAGEPLLLTLARWIEVTYGKDGPCLETVRRWARGGLIHPAPEKHGREYYVTRDARYSRPDK